MQHSMGQLNRPADKAHLGMHALAMPNLFFIKTRKSHYDINPQQSYARLTYKIVMYDQNGSYCTRSMHCMASPMLTVSSQNTSTADAHWGRCRDAMP